MSKKINQNLSFLTKLKKLPLSADNVRCLLTTKAFKTELFQQIIGVTLNKVPKIFRVYCAIKKKQCNLYTIIE